MRWRTDRLPQFQNRILRWFLANLSVFSTFLPAPPLLFFPLPLPLLFLLLLLRIHSPDAELRLGSHSSWLLRERRLNFELEDSMLSLQISWVIRCHTGRAQIPVKRHDLCAAPHANPTFTVGSPNHSGTSAREVPPSPWTMVHALCGCPCKLIQRLLRLPGPVT